MRFWTLERTVMDARVAIADTQRDLAHALYFLYYALGIEWPELLLDAQDGD